jgi:hypothetical protein
MVCTDDSRVVPQGLLVFLLFFLFLFSELFLRISVGKI